MIDRFEELRTYVAIVEAGGVNAAAAGMGIARSAVSRRLSELETRLGTRLVDRSTRRFELTAVGRAFHDESRRVLGELEAMDSRFGGEPAVAGRVVVAISRDLVGLVAPALVRFHEDHQDVRVEFVDPEHPGAAEADVTVRVADIGRGRRIAELSRVVVASPEYLKGREAPEIPADLKGHVGISVRRALAGWTFRKDVASGPDIAFEVDDDEAALALALAGAGVAQLPRPICADAIERGKLTVVLARHEPKAVPVVAEATGTAPLAAALVDRLASD